MNASKHGDKTMILALLQAGANRSLRDQVSKRVCSLNNNSTFYCGILYICTVYTVY